MAKIVIYSSKFCTYCDRAKALLDRKGVDFEDIRVDLDDEQRHIMLERSSGQRTVPQIFVGETHVGGCDDLYVLERDGQLDRLLLGD